MNTSIRKRLLVGLLSLITVACVFTLSKNYFDTRNEISELMDAQLAQSARVLLEISAHELYEQLAYMAQDNDGTGDVSEHIDIQVHKYQQEIDFQIWTADGRLAVRSSNAPNTPLTDEDEVYGDKIISGVKWRVYSLSNEDKTLRVQVGERFDKRSDLSNTISIRLLASFGIILPLLAILIFITVGRAMQPLRDVAKQIKDRRFINLQPVDTTGVCAEALPMVQALNGLFKRLQDSFEEIVLFTSNAAHELRTPLAAQKVNAQVAMQTKDEKKRQEALTEVVDSIDRATHMVEQLLTLARLDPQGTSNANEITDVGKVAEEQLSELGIEALEKHIELSLDVPKECCVRGEPSMMGVLIRNLVENAIRYTPENGTVSVRIDDLPDSCGNVHERHCHILIEDSGPGIPEDQFEKVFKRFYRVGEGHQKGTGLGLSLVKRILEIHKATIKFDKSRYGGLKVEVCFPKL